MQLGKSNDGKRGETFRVATIVRKAGEFVYVQERGGTPYRAVPSSALDIDLVNVGDSALVHIGAEPGVVATFGATAHASGTSKIKEGVIEAAGPGGTVNGLSVSKNISIVGDDGVMVTTDDASSEIHIATSNNMDFTGKDILGLNKLSFGNGGSLSSMSGFIGLLGVSFKSGDGGEYNNWDFKPNGGWRLRNRPQMQHGVDFTPDEFHWHGKTGALLFNLNSDGVVIGLPGSDNQITVDPTDGLSISGESIVTNTLEAEAIGPKLTAYISEIAGENPIYFDATYPGYDGTSPWDDLLPDDVIIASVLSRGIELWVKGGAYGHTADETIFAANNDGVRLGSGSNAVTVDPDGNVTIPSDLFVGGELSVGESIKVLEAGTNWNSWTDPDDASGIVIAVDATEGATLAGYDDGLLQSYFDSKGRIRWGNGPGIIDMGGIKYITYGMGMLDQRISDFYISNGFSGSKVSGSTTVKSPDNFKDIYQYSFTETYAGENYCGTVTWLDVPLTDHITYTYSLWIKSDSGTHNVKLAVRFCCSSPSSNETFTSQDIEVTEEWQRVSFTFKTSGLEALDTNCTGNIGHRLTITTSDGQSHDFRLYAWQVSIGERAKAYVSQYTNSESSGMYIGLTSRYSFLDTILGEKIHSRFYLGKETTPETSADYKMMVYAGTTWGYDNNNWSKNVIITPGGTPFKDNISNLTSSVLVGNKVAGNSEYLYRSVVIGDSAGRYLGSVSGSYDTKGVVLVGYGAGYYTDKVLYSTAIGYSSARYADYAKEDVAIGAYSFYNNGKNLSAFGDGGSVAVGAYAAYKATEVNNSTIIGRGAGYLDKSGSDVDKMNKVVLVGRDAAPSSTNATNQILIGYGAQGVSDNSVVLGNDDIEDTYLFGGIHTDAPNDVTGLSVTTSPGYRNLVTWTLPTSGPAVDRIEVLSNVDSGGWKIIAVLPGTSTLVYDDTYTVLAEIYYKVYTVSLGRRSSGVVTNITPTSTCGDVTNIKSIQVNDGFFLLWDDPNCRMYDGVDIKMHHATTTAGLSESSASTIYSGKANSFRVFVEEDDRDDYFQFWFYSKTKTA